MEEIKSTMQARHAECDEWYAISDDEKWPSVNLDIGDANNASVSNQCVESFSQSFSPSLGRPFQLLTRKCTT